MKEKIYLPGSIGERLKDLRTARGITIKELAEKTGVDNSTLSRIENGKNQKVSDEVLLKLAKFFNVSTDFPLGLTNVPDKKNYTAEDLDLSPEAVKKLYTGEVNGKVVSLLLADPQAKNFFDSVEVYLDDRMAAARAIMNESFSTASALATRAMFRMPEKKEQLRTMAVDMNSMRQPVFGDELEQLKMKFSILVRDVKKAKGSSLVKDAASATRQSYRQIVGSNERGERLTITPATTPEEIVERTIEGK